MPKLLSIKGNFFHSAQFKEYSSFNKDELILEKFMDSLKFPYLAGIKCNLLNIRAKIKLTVELSSKIIADFPA